MEFKMVFGQVESESWRKVHLLTMAITNRAVSAIFKGLGVFAKSAKSLGFCFVQKKKKKQNPKVLLSAWRKVIAYPLPYLS